MAETLPGDLMKVNPEEAWAPFEPSSAVPWNKKWIAHLYRRAAFGPSPSATARALADGFEKTLDRLMTGESDAELSDTLKDTGRYFRSDAELRIWWIYTIFESQHPLREKLTLFWHNHFATSYAKVQRTQLMFEQNVLLRKHALGKFRPFLLEMSKDTAMLKWLDSNQNVKGAPNENFAREVMELFSLGVGHYTEKDIQEAARAFTGWHTDSRTDEDEDTFHFKPVLHDEGSKTVFGKTGNWNGDDIVKFCCDKPDCAAFLVGKLYTFLVSETPPPKELLKPLEARFRKSNYDIADLVKTMIGSRLFFSEHAYRKRVKWPIEYSVGAVHAVVPTRQKAAEFKEHDWVPYGDLIDPLAKMGQVLFAPPNVKGWRTGTDWLNSATLLARNNFAETVATGNWIRTPRGRGPAAGATAVKAPAAVDDPAPPDMLMLLDAGPAPAGVTTGKILVGSPEQVSAAAGAIGATAVYPSTASAGPPGPPPTPNVAGSAPSPLPGNPNSPNAPPPADTRLDPAQLLFQPKPKDVAALVKKMGELLYGDELPPAARNKIERFLLDGKKTLGEKDLDNPAFKQRTREALHALMCLPEYQLN